MTFHTESARVLIISPCLFLCNIKEPGQFGEVLSSFSKELLKLSDTCESIAERLSPRIQETGKSQ